MQHLDPSDFVDDAAALLEQSAAEHELAGRSETAQRQRRTAALLRAGGVEPA